VKVNVACDEFCHVKTYHSEHPAGVRSPLTEAEFPLFKVPRLAAVLQAAFGGGGGGGRLQVRVTAPLPAKPSATVPAVPPIEQGRPFRLFKDGRAEASRCQSTAHAGWDG
jgi:hypothetical protein